MPSVTTAKGSLTWGCGTLGDGSPDGLRISPAPVPSSNGTLDQVVQLSARDNDAIALRADGPVWTWGSFSQDISPT
jgi:alpha-tubulin suppressor-like RCC1 family protein